MKNITLLVSCLCLMLFALFFYSQHTTESTTNLLALESNLEESETEESEEEERENKRKAYDEWFARKKNKDGVIPSGLVAKWNNHDIRVRREAERAGVTSRNNPFSTTYLGPESTGGRTRAIMVDQSNPDRYFAGGVSGGLWRSDDAGASWTPINDMASSLTVTSIVQDPQNANVIYYTTGERISSSIGLTGNGVFKSVDGGLTFNPLPATVDNSDFEFTWVIAHSPTEPNTIYVCAHNGGLQRSKDGGQTWEEVFSVGRIYDVVIFPKRTVLVTSSAGIYRSGTGDVGTFTQVTNPQFPPNSVSKTEIANCEQQPNVVYAFFATNNQNVSTLFKSTDSGLTWTATANDFNSGGQGGYDVLLGVHPSDPDRVVIGTIGALYSTDGFATTNNSGILAWGHPDYHIFVPIPGDPETFLVGNDGGVYRYKWNSIETDFDDLNDGYGVTQFYRGNYAAQGSEAIGGTQDNGSWQIRPNNSQFVHGADGFSCYLSNTNPNLAFTSQQNGVIGRNPVYPNLCSFANGCVTTSIPIETGALSSFHTLFEVNRADENQLYAASLDGLWRMVWNGSGYTVGQLSDSHIITGIDCSNDANPTVYATTSSSGNGPRLLRVDNAATAGSSSWVNMSSSIPGLLGSQTLWTVKMDENNPGVVYVGLSSYDTEPRIYRVTGADTNDPINSPPNWTAINSNLPSALPVNSIAIDPAASQNIFIGTDFGLYYTLNGGVSWVKETSIPNVPIDEVRMRADRSLFVFTHGRGAWQVDLGQLSAVDYVGIIATELGGGVAQAELPSCGVFTALDGSFTCQGFASGGTYTFTPEKDIFATNGVNIGDLYLLQLHILAITPLSTPYRIISADVNSNGSVNVGDLVEMQNLILSITTSFPNTPSWKFVDKGYTFINPANPLNEAFPQSVTVSGSTGANPLIEFVGVKMGDLNVSNNPALRLTAPALGPQLVVADQPLKAGEVIEVPVRVKGFKEQIGYQMVLELDESQVEVLAWEAGDLPYYSDDLFHKEGNQLHHIWYDKAGAASSLEDGEALFVLKLRAKQDLASLRESLRLKDALMENIAFDFTMEPRRMSMDFEAATAPSTPVEAFAVTGFRPNPFQDNTSIIFQLPEPSAVTLQVFDAAGKLLAQSTQRFGAGQQQFDLDQTGDWPTGTLIYRLSSHLGLRSGKLVKAN